MPAGSLLGVIITVILIGTSLVGCAASTNDSHQVRKGVTSLLVDRQGVNVDAVRQSTTRRSYPVPFEQVWRDVLTVVGQIGFISKCDPQTGIVVAVVSTNQTVAALVLPEDPARTAVFVQVQTDGSSQAHDTNTVEQTVLDKISTQLLARYRLTHLLVGHR